MLDANKIFPVISYLLLRRNSRSWPLAWPSGLNKIRQLSITIYIVLTNNMSLITIGNSFRYKWKILIRVIYCIVELHRNPTFINSYLLYLQINAYKFYGFVICTSANAQNVIWLHTKYHLPFKHVPFLIRYFGSII